jgi:hypothetical protein
MPDNQDITLKIRVLDAQGQFRGGTVDVEFKHQTLSDHGMQRGLDASREINIAGLRRAPQGDYQITVTPTDRFEPKSQFVNIPASGSAMMKVTIDRVRIPDPRPDPTFVVKGAVRTAAGAPFINGLVRAIRQNASAPVLLGEGRTDNQGNYVIKYSSTLVTGAINLSVQVFDENGKLLAHSDPTAPAKREEVVNLTLPTPEPPVTAYRVEGKVSRPDLTMVVDAMVQVFDVSTGREQLLGKAITDGTGHFKITYLGKPFEARGGADLIVRVFDSQGRVLATSAVIRKAKPLEQVSLVSNDEPAVEQPPFVVRGTVREANGKPVAGVNVRAFDRDLRSEEPLGNATADSQGSYEIHYGPEQFRRADKESADLIVRVYNDKREELAASPIIFNAKPQEVVDLTIELDKLRPQSEYERYIAELDPVLDDVPLARLTSADVTFLAGETAIDRQHIDYLVSSQIWSPETGVQPAALYGMLRTGLPATFPELLAESEQRKRAALESAISSNIIPLSIQDEIDSILARLHHSFVQRIIQQPGPNGQVTIGRVLAGALPLPELQAAFVSASITHSQSGDSTESFWDKLRGDARFGSDDIDSIRFTVQVGALTSNHPPLIEALQKKRRDGEMSSLRDLARLDAADWEDLIQQTTNGSDLPTGVPGKDAAEKIKNFATTIASSVELQFPTAVIASRLSRDDGFDMPHKAAVATFLDAHKDFDFAATNITSYLDLHKETALKGVDDPQSFTDQLEKMQRVAHVAPRYEQMRTLITKGLDSSLAISHLSPERFANKYANDLGGTAAAYAVHDAAGQKTAVTNALLADVHSIVAGTHMAVLPIQDQAKKIADLRTLFGSLDFCDCSDCRSVLSPAAYLVDVLEFLKHRNSQSDAVGREDPRSVRDILFRRRPDIGEIELTCENTNTPVPYLDLVNELLENAVAPIVQPDDWHHLPLSSAKHEQFQTRLSAEELSAYPEHLNSRAYELLRAASFPWSLPFDLWMEETRAYLSHLGTSRADLIATFRPSAAPADPSSVAIAQDTLGLTPKAWDVIVDTSLSRVPQDWGDGLGWPNADFADVRSFLDRSGLTSAELTDLLDTRFINSNPARRDIDIEPPGSCDIDEMRLTGITDMAGVIGVSGHRILSRIHRFVRLWRTLGWTMRELDTSIRALAATDLDQTFLLRLSDLRRVQSRLRMPLAQMLGLYADLDTDGPDALYNVVFRSPGVLSQFSDATFDPAHLPVSRGIDSHIAEHAPTILAALNIKANELTILLTALRRFTPDPPNPWLTLRNISFLYRHSLLSRALKLTIEEHTTLLFLTGIDPFNKEDIGGTLRFVDAVQTIRESGFTIDELVYLFGGTTSATSSIAPSTDSIAQALESLRASLPTPVAAAAISLDEKETKTRELLTQLGWNPEVIEEVPNLISNRILYDWPLSPLPARFTFPASLASQVSYDASNQLLRFRGVMSDAEKSSLIDDNGLMDPLRLEYVAAVEALYEKPRQFVRRAFPAFIYKTPFAEFSSTLRIPSDVTQRFGYDADTRSLWFAGPMTETERRTLRSLSSAADFPEAIDRLFHAPEADTQPADTAFLTRVEMNRLMEDPLADRLEILLSRLRPYASRKLRTGVIVQGLSQSLNMTSELLLPLLTRHLSSDGTTDAPLITDFLDAPFSDSDRTTRITDDSPFSNLFRAYRLLHKVALVLSKFNVSQRELKWLFHPVDSTDRGLDLNLLARVSARGYEAPEGYRLWSRLVDLFKLRFRLGVEGLERIMTGAAQRSTDIVLVFQAISAAGAWRVDDVQSIADHLGLNRVQLGGDRALTRLRDCCDVVRQLGVTAQQCWSWTELDLGRTDPRRPDPARLIAEEIRQAVKAHYSSEQWTAVAKPLRDTLRVRQAAALVSYLLAHPPAALLAVDPPIGLPWRTAGDLYAYFLVDVEMGSCAMTSRIKLAHSSIQLFIQRCLLDIEPEVRADSKHDSGWLQWEEWMKNYRVWEANRKIFLYPENWVEPELRDDKTTLFKDLENELLQNDPTTETTEAAFAKYFETLDTIARPEIVAMYREPGNRAILHVFGRTRGTSHVYYYRRQIRTEYGSSWTAWEKVNVDIEGDHLIPVVWNSRLYLFWPTFMEQTEQQQTIIPRPGDPMQEPRKYLKMQLAWSQYRDNRWTAKTISRESARIPSNDSTDFFYQAFPSDGGDLVVRCIARIRRGFRFAVSDKELMPPAPVTRQIDFRFSGSDGTLRRMPLVIGDFIQLLPGTHLEGMTFVEDGNWGMPTPELLGARVQGPLASLYGLSFKWRNTTGDLFPRTPGPDGVLVPFNTSSQNADASDVWDAPIAITSDTPIQSIPFDQPFVLVRRDLVRTGRELQIPMPPFGTPVILARTPEMTEASNFFRVLLPYDFRSPVEEFFFQDNTRTFLAKISADQAMLLDFQARVQALDPHEPEHLLAMSLLAIALSGTLQYDFYDHYHPFVRVLMQTLNREGIDGLMQREVQLLGANQSDYFRELYGPTARVRLPGPIEEIDFSSAGAYAQYNWELFFHAPLLIAGKLSANQRFAEAQKWYHYIFDPTDTSPEEPPRRYWRTRPFFETTSEEYQQQRIDNLLQGLSGTHDPMLDNQVQQWRENPFNPHLVARLRTTAFQKTVVMKYLDNLVAWGDQLFRQDTLESINEATQLYMLAAEILGPRPARIRPSAQPQVQTYHSLEPMLDSFSNALVRAENATPPTARRAASALPIAPSNGGGAPHARATQSAAQSTSGTQPGDERLVPPVTIMMPPLPPALYFCVPSNSKLLGYWDTVSDRLFKVRHCMNIEGVLRQLPLFEPPIDPALLVRGRAAGIDMRSLMSETGAAAPQNYRFAVLAQKAGELCADVRGFGGALLSALEKRDAEAFARLRSGHELAVLSQMEQIKEYQIEEATRALEGMRKSRETIALRREHYASLAFMSPGELIHLALMTHSLQDQTIAAELDHIGNVLHVIPNFKGAFFTSIGLTFGGENLGNAVQAFSRYISAQASILGAMGGMSATLEGYRRRSEEWGLQIRLADKELEQIDKQIIAAEIRVAIARQDLRMHLLHAEQTRQADEFMRTKFTNRELYDWMVTQLSALYFQSYQMAYDMAKRAERAYQFERGIATSTFVTFGHWDSLHRGLLAGERLHMELKRLEIEYINQNKRDFELSRNISLALHDPFALHRLRTTGTCIVDLPESLFDHDHPGHFMRRIKSVALTLPAVVGPYTSVNCRLTLQSSSVRVDPSAPSHYRAEPDKLSDVRFRNDLGSVQSIATSRAHSDTGMFEVNFRDERYLPFEGSGVISTWQIDLDPRCNDFDLSTLSDVVMELRYTARDGGNALRNRCLTEMTASSSHEPQARLFSARTDFADAWNEFLYPISNTPGQTLTLDIDRNRFGFRAQQGTIAISEIHVVLMLSQEGARAYPSGGGLKVVIIDPNLRTVTPGPTVTPPSPAGLALPAGTTPGTRDVAGGFVSLTPAGGVGQWKITLPNDVLTLPQSARLLAPIVSGSHARLAPAMVEDILVFVVYQ